jgi:hypothetical protein
MFNVQAAPLNSTLIHHEPFAAIRTVDLARFGDGQVDHGMAKRAGAAVAAYLPFFYDNRFKRLYFTVHIWYIALKYPSFNY